MSVQTMISYPTSSFKPRKYITAEWFIQSRSPSRKLFEKQLADMPEYLALIEQLHTAQNLVAAGENLATFRINAAREFLRKLPVYKIGELQ